MRWVGGPTDVSDDLALSFPKPDSVFGGLIPPEYFRWKERLHEEYGLKTAISYQSLFQLASESRTDTKHAWAGWALLELQWEALDRGGDYEGSLVVALDWRHTFSGSEPATFGLVDVGSAWPSDFAYIDLGPTFFVFYWEQWFRKDRFVLRVGKQIASQIFDFFRSKDPRTSFSAAPFTSSVASIPSPPPGIGLSFELWPIEGSDPYVVGTLNDMNGDPERLGLDTFFEELQCFYGIEVGNHWRREGNDFDHVHLNVFYANRVREPLPGASNEPGWGFKVLGSKQWSRIVVFSSYTYNTSRGGGFSVTLGRHTVTAGVALVKPLGIRGEAALGLAWIDPANAALRDQFGGELYWKILLTPDFWITPGVQFIVNPSFNPDTGFVVIGQLKFRLFF